MSDQDDERWITERDNEPGASFRTCMRAALARGYERGKAGGGVAERDRLAKRCEELEALLTRGVEIVEGDDATASRLAALEQRVGGIIEALLGCFGPDGAESYGDMARRLAALRAPGVDVDDGPPPMTPELQARLEAYQPSYTRLTAEGRAAFDAYDGPVSCGPPSDFPEPHSCEAAEQAIEALEADLATARRERDEAVGVVRALVDVVSGCKKCDHPLSLSMERARALVAGQGVAQARPPVCDICGTVGAKGSPIGPPLNGWVCDGCDKAEPSRSSLAARDAEIAGLKREVDALGDHVRAHFRDKERALDELSQARIEVETIQSKLAGAEHAIADLTTTFGTVESERDTLRARIAELEAREKGARWLLATAHITKSLTPPEWHSKREAWLAGGHAAPIPDPARGLIERAATVLETYVPLSEDELIADLRAYLGGGT